jgi:hypothetical protein
MGHFDEHYPQATYTDQTLQELYRFLRLNQFLIEAVIVTAEKRDRERNIEKRMIENMSDKEKIYATVTDLKGASGISEILCRMARRDWYLCKPEYDIYPPSCIVDGKIWEPWEVLTLEPEAIKELYILKGSVPRFLYGRSSVICINLDTVKISKASTAYRRTFKRSLPKYTFTKEFYQPVYDTPEKKNDPTPDLRKTIHWEPDVLVNSDGEATVTFYNADIYTGIKCILQGFTDDGIPVYGETDYEVFFLKGE